MKHMKRYLATTDAVDMPMNDLDLFGFFMFPISGKEIASL